MAIECLASAVVNIDVHYAILLIGYATPGVGDGDDVVELLANVGGNDEIATLRSQ